MTPRRTRANARTASLLILIGVGFAIPAPAAERELQNTPPASSANEIQTTIQRVFPEAPVRPLLLPWLREQLEGLPPFFADTQLEARFRTYYLYKDRTSGSLNEAWAMGGSVAYRSGWLADLLQFEVEGFTSQPLIAPDSRDGTGLLESGQSGYSVLGIANAKLRYRGLVLTGYRQYLDLPYANRNDSRMTPNTFESITLAKPEGPIRFSTGYTFGIKQRTEDDFESMTEAVGLDEERGMIHAGAVWDPNDDFHVGAIVGIVPDLLAGVYAELGFGRELSNGWQARLDTQFGYRGDIGDDLLGDALDDTWNLGIRTTASRAGAVFRLGFSITGSGGSIDSFFGSSPSYVDLMQRGFNEQDVKALLASASYDFSHVGIDGLSIIANFVAGFGADPASVRGNAQEIDVTLDYRVKKGWLKNLWLRARGSWLHQESSDGSDFRLILRYDFSVL